MERTGACCACLIRRGCPQEPLTRTNQTLRIEDTNSSVGDAIAERQAAAIEVSQVEGDRSLVDICCTRQSEQFAVRDLAWHILIGTKGCSGDSQGECRIRNDGLVVVTIHTHLDVSSTRCAVGGIASAHSHDHVFTCAILRRKPCDRIGCVCSATRGSDFHAKLSNDRCTARIFQGTCPNSLNTILDCVVFQVGDWECGSDFCVGDLLSTHFVFRAVGQIQMRC